MFSLPPHLTHLTQPLDKGTLGHLRFIGERNAGCTTALILVALSQDISSQGFQFAEVHSFEYSIVLPAVYRS